ncbi:MAG TPA: phosphomannomutase, partial [Stellaceae bacterium]
MRDGGAGSGHVFNPTILREYDVRGIVGETLGEADARALGRAFATVVAEKGGKRVAVGRDGRLSSPKLEAALVDGLTGGGIDVVRIGLGPTPMLYFAVNTLPVDGGIMVTGSHNPANYNGFKLMLGKKSFFGQDIQRLGRIAAEAPRPTQRTGQVEEKSVVDAYVARLLADYDGTRPLNVAWDAGNGATGEVLQRLAKQLPGKHV